MTESLDKVIKKNRFESLSDSSVENENTHNPNVHLTVGAMNILRFFIS